MKEIYKKIWKLAKPYYEKGREMDIEHIEWMMGEAVLICEKEKVDGSLLIPLVILHDVGYAEFPKGDYFKEKMRRNHMRAGAKIAKKILKESGYDPERIEKISYYVSVHDNWAFGDDGIYKKNKILGIFTDLDYIWMATPKGFKALMKLLDKTSKEMLEYLKTNEKPIKRPFATETTKRLYKRYLKDRIDEDNN